MSRAAVIALWLACAFVTWNVVFDRHVALAALTFTREQIDRHERGDATSRIDEAFEPQVGRAAVIASLYAAGVLAGGAALLKLTR